MTRHLPLLNQLRAFEAAARHESFKDCAAELCVTATAVGHQIKALEQTLNTLLFHRQTRKVVLTKAGQERASQIGAALLGPVCAPQLVAERQLPLSPDEILGLRLASASRWRDDWTAWAKAAGA